MSKPSLRPEQVAPYFVVVSLIHLAAVWTRFDLVEAKLPVWAPTAIMLSQLPLILLSGYFEGRLDYGPEMANFPLWMRIKSKPVKAAFTLGFMYVAAVSLQTLHFSLGPIDPTPPLSFPPAQRAAWYAMFSFGMFFVFYLAATGILIPFLRAITAPLRALPNALGALLALVLGGGIGVLVFAVATKTKLVAFIDLIKGTIANNALLSIGVTAAMTFGPMLIGLVFAKKDD
ncbi:MAG: hypothetical protein QM831_42165 [Kofleriaceae bacterium]